MPLVANGSEINEYSTVMKEFMIRMYACRIAQY